MGAINNNYSETTEIILRDAATPYSFEERCKIADGAISFCRRLNLGYSKYRAGLLGSPVISFPLAALGHDKIPIERFNIDRPLIESMTEQLREWASRLGSRSS